MIHISAFENNQHLHSVSLPPDSSLRLISKSAFYGCHNLSCFRSHRFQEKNHEIHTPILFPPSLFSIGRTAFNKTTISHFVFPRHSLCSQPFNIDQNNSSNFQTVALPASLRHIPPQAFEDSNISTLLFSRSIHPFSLIVDEQCFAGTSNLLSVVLPISIKKVGSYAFARSEIRRVVLPPKAQHLGDALFYGCSKLDRIIIPKTVLSIGMSCFYQSGITECVFLPDSQINHIMDLAFFGCLHLHSIYLPSSLNMIGERCFANSKLQNVTFAEQEVMYNAQGMDPVIFIGRRAFAGCRFLKKLELPASLTSLTHQLHDSSIQSLSFQKGSRIQHIPPSSFRGSSIREITLPARFRDENICENLSFLSITFDGEEHQNENESES